MLRPRGNIAEEFVNPVRIRMENRVETVFVKFDILLCKTRDVYHCFRTNIDQFMLSQGLHVTVPIETPDESLLQQLVEAGLGIATTYDFTAVSHCGENTVVRYLDDDRAGDRKSVV